MYWGGEGQAMAKGPRTGRAKLALLVLAKELGNVSEACKIMGFSRDSYYRFKGLYEGGGELALAETGRRKPITKNRVAPEVEDAIVKMAFAQPTWGQVKVSRKLGHHGLKISPAGVRSVRLRHGLETKEKRLRALKSRAQRDELSLTSETFTALSGLRSKEPKSG